MEVGCCLALMGDDEEFTYKVLVIVLFKRRQMSDIVLYFDMTLSSNNTNTVVKVN